MIHLLLNTPADAVVIGLNDDELVAKMAEGIPLIDIRRPYEWEETGVIEGSHLITFFDDRNKYDLDVWLAAFDKITDRDKPFILICRHGIRTGKLGRFLDGREDFRQVFHHQQGITRWIEGGHPVRDIEL
jgi:rhodanese-related sulfurtransferase